MMAAMARMRMVAYFKGSRESGFRIFLLILPQILGSQPLVNKQPSCPTHHQTGKKRAKVVPHLARDLAAREDRWLVAANSS